MIFNQKTSAASCHKDSEIVELSSTGYANAKDSQAVSDQGGLAVTVCLIVDPIIVPNLVTFYNQFVTPKSYRELYKKLGLTNWKDSEALQRV